MNTLLIALLPLAWAVVSIIALATALCRRHLLAVAGWASVGALCLGLALLLWLRPAPALAVNPLPGTAPTVAEAAPATSLQWGRVAQRYPAVAAWQGEIEAAAATCDVPAAWVAAIVALESAGHAGAQNPNSGAAGLMQLMPITAREMDVADRFDPRQNLRGGACYFWRMLDRYRLDPILALAAYNAGPGAVGLPGRVPDNAETRRYVQIVPRLFGCFTTDLCWFGQRPVLGGATFKEFGVPVDYQAGGAHTGLDLVGAPLGSAEPGLYAVGEAVVVYVGPLYCDLPDACRGSQAIVLRHADLLYSVYSHNSAAFVAAGDVVAAGALIGRQGAEGYALGSHLHFEIVQGCEWSGDWTAPWPSADCFVDPAQWIPEEE